MTNLPTEIVSKVAQKKAELDTLRRAFSEELRVSCGDLFKAFFEAHPEADEIRWRQYTPYFNDGEPCEFRVYDPELFLADGAEERDEDAEGYCTWSLAHYPSDEHKPLITEGLVKDFEAVASMLQSDADSMRMIFGDHALVVATRNGISVEEYDHE